MDFSMANRRCNVQTVQRTGSTEMLLMLLFFFFSFNSVWKNSPAGAASTGQTPARKRRAERRSVSSSGSTAAGSWRALRARSSASGWWWWRSRTCWPTAAAPCRRRWARSRNTAAAGCYPWARTPHTPPDRSHWASGRHRACKRMAAQPRWETRARRPRWRRRSPTQRSFSAQGELKPEEGNFNPHFHTFTSASGGFRILRASLLPTTT